jgi:uncharacterized BrkB/YihY/UPF0761 family membrane protein
MANKTSSPSESGLDEYPKSAIILANLTMVLWLVIGTIASWFFSPVAAAIYAVFAVSMVFFVLRKLVCTNCYYYGKWCATGWGKLAALFFKRGDTGKVSTSAGIKLASLTYGLLSLIPLILIVVSLIGEFTIPKISVAVFLFAVSFYSGAVSRGKACKQCKMRNSCPGAPKNAK